MCVADAANSKNIAHCEWREGRASATRRCGGGGGSTTTPAAGKGAVEIFRRPFGAEFYQFTISSRRGISCAGPWRLRLRLAATCCCRCRSSNSPRESDRCSSLGGAVWKWGTATLSMSFFCRRRLISNGIVPSAAAAAVGGSGRGERSVNLHVAVSVIILTKKGIGVEAPRDEGCPAHCCSIAVLIVVAVVVVVGVEGRGGGGGRGAA